MSDNESYELAREWVLEQINREVRGNVIPSGRTIRVGDMQKCDCIPFNVLDCQNRRWSLDAVHRNSNGYIEAEYVAQ